MLLKKFYLIILTFFFDFPILGGGGGINPLALLVAPLAAISLLAAAAAVAINPVLVSLNNFNLEFFSLLDNARHLCVWVLIQKRFNSFFRFKFLSRGNDVNGH